MDNAKQQLVEKLKASNNVLVTVSRNPSVDQLSALIGISLLLNKQGKHCAAVFSGEVPSTLEFLKPEDTIEKTTDSLRDFIIALDKSKADKLRYKVEDNVVRIFITPYRTSITQEDLDFSQGDFNVDLVIALGVSKQEDLDEAITAHGRILHDAVVASITVSGEANLGLINWFDPGASSLSELVTDLAQFLGEDLIDQQVATALLTGIVAETNRFSNNKTSSQTMSASAILMSAGANQQLVASQLDEPASDQTQLSQAAEENVQPVESNNDDGTLEIEHSSQEVSDTSSADFPSEVTPADETESNTNMELPEPEAQEVIDETDDTNVDQPIEQGPSAGLTGGPSIMTEPPSLGGTLTASANDDYLDPVTDPMTLASNAQPQQILERPAPFDQASTPPFNKTAFADVQEPLPPQMPYPADTSPSAVPPIAPVLNQATPAAPLASPVAAFSQPTPASINNYFTPPPPSWSPPPAPSPVPPVNTVIAEPDDNYNSSNAVAPPADIHTPELQIDESGTLSQLEEAVHSPHLLEQAPAAESARQEVDNAINAVPSGPQPPIAALNAQPLGPSLHSDPQDQDDQTTNASAPPPVPPPIPFEFGKPPAS